MTYPARCPGCGAIVEATLATYPDVPVYVCGSTPLKLRCIEMLEDERRAGRPDPTYNVMQPTEGELEQLDLVGSELGLALIRVWRHPTAPVVGLCCEPGCYATAIDGWCLTHDEQIVEAMAQARRAELGVADV